MLRFIILDSGKIECGVFLDLQKAFDTVHHQILLHKLFNYGVKRHSTKLVSQLP